MQDNQFMREILSTAEGGMVKYNGCDIEVRAHHNYYKIYFHDGRSQIDIMDYYSYEDTKMCFEIITNKDHTIHRFSEFIISMIIEHNMSTIQVTHRNTYQSKSFKYDYSSYTLSNYLIKSKEVFEMLCSSSTCEMAIIDEYIRIMDRRNTKNANY